MNNKYVAPGKYYVYVGPGHIFYTDDLDKAIDYAQNYPGTRVKEC